MRPKPAGIAIYGALRPNASAQATALLSIFKRFITASSGGTRIGMKAICTGIRFCDMIAIITNIQINRNFFCEIAEAIFLDKIGARPVCVTAVAKAPKRM